MNTNQKTALVKQIEACGISESLSPLEHLATRYAKSELKNRTGMKLSTK